GRWRFSRRELRYGLQQSLAVAERDAELFKVAIAKIGEHIQINFIVAKLFLVLTQAATAKPFVDVHSHAPLGLPRYSLSRRALSRSGRVLLNVELTCPK